MSHVLERDITTPTERAEIAPGVTWRRASIGDFQSLTSSGLRLHNAGRRQYALKRLEQGSVCLLAEAEGQVAHICWISFNRMVSPPYDFSLGKGWAYLSHARTPPEFRGRKIHLDGIHRRMELAREIGCTRVVSLVDIDNPASLNNHLRAGFNSIDRVWSVRFLNRWNIQRRSNSLREQLAKNV